MDPGAERLIIEQCERFGQPLPESIANKPELFPGSAVYYDAFWDLKIENVISWQSIANYAMFYGFDEEQTEDLFNHVRALDLAFNKNKK